MSTHLRPDVGQPDLEELTAEDIAFLNAMRNPDLREKIISIILEAERQTA